MVIAFFIGNIAGHGGTERMTITLANYLVERGFGVNIFSLVNINKAPSFLIDPRVSVDFILDQNDKLKGNLFLALIRLRKLCLSRSIQVIIDVDILLSGLSICSLLFSRIKIVSWEHFNFHVSLGLKMRKFSRFLASIFSNVIVTLTSQDAQIYKKKLCPVAKVISINNCVENVAYKRSNLTNKIVLAVGRFTYQKGFDLLLSVWSKLLLVKEFSDWKLVLVGDGEDKSMLCDSILKYNISNNVEVHPFSTEIHRYYEDASIYLMTSRFEGLPMVLLEAMSHGLPIIAYDCITGPSEVISSQNGFLVPFGDEEQLLNALIKLITDQSLRNAMGENSFLDSYRFKPEVLVDKWIELFNSL